MSIIPLPISQWTSQNDRKFLIKSIQTASANIVPAAFVSTDIFLKNSFEILNKYPKYIKRTAQHPACILKGNQNKLRDQYPAINKTKTIIILVPAALDN